MFNIKFRGKFIDENELKGATLPSNAVKFKEPNNITKLMLLGIALSSPILVSTLIALFVKIGGVKNINFNWMLVEGIIYFLLLFIHEIIHGFALPKEIEKYIWTKLEEGALFIHWETDISKGRFIWVSLAPNLILGFIPFFMFLSGIFDFNADISQMIGIISWFMILGGVGDYLNIYNAIKQVPNKARVMNYGMHSYWFENYINDNHKKC